MDYYNIVIITAVNVFICTMIIFWYYSNVKSDEFPPVMTNCPLNCIVNPVGTCTIPIVGVNIGNLKGQTMYKKLLADGTVTYTMYPTYGSTKYTDNYGNPYLAYTGSTSGVKFPDFPAGYDANTPEKNIVDFRLDEWSENGNVLCANHDWAVKHNIYWEGVSNYNRCRVETE
jgi:hypothetical protein